MHDEDPSTDPYEQAVDDPASEEPAPHSGRRRRPSLVFAGLAITTLSTLCIFARCSGGQAVTEEALAAARDTWAEAGIRDYDIEWTSSGNVEGRYVVTVRGGEVRRVEGVAADGRRSELSPAEKRFYGVDGLFTTIADELAQLKSDRPFGSPRGMKVVMRFTPDPRLGYPRLYRRDVMGTSQGLAIDVIRLTPLGVRPGSSGPRS
ncbi:DUF6174 domain-containing protein [Aquisphaera insulae]|uniref:DUF6174 domain-containing protein n=1 Tax=Aquisphaera insulae TaxID=2712864 RepID=UPI00202DFE02|nr:DUF6174 domain-containing protein [Aquisphaera insulae]